MGRFVACGWALGGRTVAQALLAGQARGRRPGGPWPRICAGRGRRLSLRWGLWGCHEDRARQRRHRGTLCRQGTLERGLFDGWRHRCRHRCRHGRRQHRRQHGWHRGHDQLSGRCRPQGGGCSAPPRGPALGCPPASGSGSWGTSSKAQRAAPAPTLPPSGAGLPRQCSPIGEGLPGGCSRRCLQRAASPVGIGPAHQALPGERRSALRL